MGPTRRHPGIGIAAVVAVLMFMAVAVCAGAAEPWRYEISPATGLDPVTGLWRMAPDGAVIAIEPGVSRDSYRLRIIDSPDYNVVPGALLGTMTATATPLVFDATLSDHPGVEGSKTHTFFVRIDPQRCRLSLEPYDATPKISLRRWLPYFFRIVYSKGRRPADHDGAVRIGREGPVAL